MTTYSMTVLWDGNSPCYSWATLQRPTVWQRLGHMVAWLRGDDAGL